MATTTPTPNLKLFFLQGSRAIRVAWLLEELNLPYENIFFARTPALRAPENMSTESKSSMGKSPVLHDDDLVLTESGAITEYLLEKYDPEGKLSGGNDRAKKELIRTFIHAAEGTFMIHLLSIPFSRWFATPGCDELAKIEKGILGMVWKDLDWLESVLADETAGKERYLVGTSLSAADTMVLFPIQLIFRRNYCGGRAMGEWKNIEKWVERCESREGWKRTVEKTGYTL